MSELQERDELDLGTQLLKVETHTLDDGRVRGRIVGLDDGEDSIDVSVMVLTTRETITESFEKPRSWSRSNEFVRLVEWCGYNSANAMEILDCEVPLADEDGDGWEIDIERMPGEGFFEQWDYYRGVGRGAIGALASAAGLIGLGGLTGDLVIRVGFPTITSAVGYLLVVAIVLVMLISWWHSPLQDDRETVSFDDIQSSDKRGLYDPEEADISELGVNE